MDVTPDSSYYLYDGNTVFQVESTLFKVHRSVLTRDDSTFEDMFSLDLEDHREYKGSVEDVPVDGSCDRYPIHLQGDTVDEFRALLWSLYALPSDIVYATTQGEDIDAIKFVNLARISHKYHFTSTEIWALDTLTSYLSCVPLPIHIDDEPPEVEKLTADILENLTRVAVLCTGEDQPLFEEVTEKWELLLGHGHGVYAETAIRVTESLGLRNLRASAYYAMMRRGRQAWDLEPTLSREHRIILLSGHYSFFNLCRDLLKSPPDAHSKRCSSENCRRCWSSFWKALIGGTSGIPAMDYPYPLDVMAKLELAQNLIQGRVREVEEVYLLSDKMQEDCRKRGKKVIQELAQKVKSRLQDYFPDVA